MATATSVTSEEFLARRDEFDQSGTRIKEELIAEKLLECRHHAGATTGART